MLTRIVSGLFGIGLFIAVCFSGRLPFTAMVIGIACVAGAEFMRAQALGPKPPAPPEWARRVAALSIRVNPFLAACGLMVLPYAYSITLSVQRKKLEIGLDAILTAVVLCGIVLVLRSWKTGVPLGWFRAFYGKIGFWYIGPLLSSLILIRCIPGKVQVGPFAPDDLGAWLVMFVAVCVWSTDTFAYFVGRAVGRHKLAPNLSPGKTIEGFAGGFAGAMVAGAIMAHAIGLTWSNGVVVGAIAGLLGPIGDLFESGLKRELRIKDFGSVMPGHGGALDRFDSLMFVAPVALLYLLFVTG